MIYRTYGALTQVRSIGFKYVADSAVNKAGLRN